MEQNIEIKKISIFRNALNYGLMLGIAMIIVLLLFYAFNIENEKIIQYINLVLMLAGIVLGIINYRNNVNSGYISYGKSLGSGVLIGLVSSIVVAIYTFVFYKFIDPSMLDVILRKAEDKMLEQNPTITDEQLELAMNYTRKFLNPVWMSISLVLWSTFFSFIAALIISIFTKKNNSTFESNFN